MQYRTLGKTNLQVSEVGFGCWAIGGTGYGPVKDEESLEALEAAWNHGVNFFDTADSYGEGHSETILAKFLAGKPREKVLIATKGGHDFYHGPVRKNFDPAYLRFACEESLKRLGTDYIDLYQLHTPRLDVIEQGDAVGELEKLQKAGKIRSVGVSVYSEEEALACLADERIGALQIVFNLIDQRMGDEVLPESLRRGVGVIAREPLACGLLSGKYVPGQRFHEQDHRNGWSEEKLETELKKIEKLTVVFGTKRISMVQAALEYALDFQGISTVIPGAKTAEQAAENILASEEPSLRSQEASHLRDLYGREAIFQHWCD